MRNKILAVAIAAAGVALSGVSMAGPGGTAGPTSSLDSVVTLQVNGAIRIQQVTNINLGIFNPLTVAPMVGVSQACVGRAGGTDYSVTVTSLNGSFGLLNPATPVPMPYTVEWRDDGAEAYTALTHGVVSGVPGTAYTADVGNLGACGGETDDKLRVTVQYADMLAGTAGTYTDTLTVLVAPL